MADLCKRTDQKQFQLRESRDDRGSIVYRGLYEDANEDGQLKGEFLDDDSDRGETFLVNHNHTGSPPLSNDESKEIDKLDNTKEEHKETIHQPLSYAPVSNVEEDIKEDVEKDVEEESKAEAKDEDEDEASVPALPSRVFRATHLLKSYTGRKNVHLLLKWMSLDAEAVNSYVILQCLLLLLFMNMRTAYSPPIQLYLLLLILLSINITRSSRWHRNLRQWNMTEQMQFECLTCTIKRDRGAMQLIFEGYQGLYSVPSAEKSWVPLMKGLWIVGKPEIALTTRLDTSSLVLVHLHLRSLPVHDTITNLVKEYLRAYYIDRSEFLNQLDVTWKVQRQQKIKFSGSESFDMKDIGLRM
ncbi:hypothetical protein BKA93DRAFT_747587 [Sparassis latifolia]